MKKSLFIIFTCLMAMLISCSNDERPTTDDTEKNKTLIVGKWETTYITFHGYQPVLEGNKMIGKKKVDENKSVTIYDYYHDNGLFLSFKFDANNICYEGNIYLESKNIKIYDNGDYDILAYGWAYQYDYNYNIYGNKLRIYDNENADNEFKIIKLTDNELVISMIHSRFYDLYNLPQPQAIITFKRID